MAVGMGKLMVSNKYDFASIILGVTTSTFFMDLLEKVVMTSLAMLAGTTVSFFWRRFLYKKFKFILRKKKEEEENGPINNQQNKDAAPED